MWLIYLIYLVGGVFIVFGFIAMVAGPKGRGVPYVPTGKKKVQLMVELANMHAGEKMADLGSGDGRILIAFARKGIEVHGYELNPVLALWTWLRIRFLGLQHIAHIHMGSFWHEDLSRFNVITVFGLPPMMVNLEEKLRRELKTGSRVFSNTFYFPTWKRDKEEGGISVYTVVR